MPDVVVGRELRRQPVERVGDARGERHEQTGRPGGAPQRERSEREDGEHAEAGPKPRSLGVVGDVCGRGEREQRDAHDDRDHRGELTATDALVQAPRSDREQEHEARTDERLDERERGARERKRLHEPASEPERRPEQPPRPGDEAPEERDAQRVLRRGFAGLQRLVRDSDRVQSGRAERSHHSDHETRHGPPRR